MQITHEQLGKMRLARLAGFRSRLRHHLERTFPTQCARLGPGVLERNLQECVDRAARFGIGSERGIAKFVETTYWLFWHPEHRDLATWAHRVLASEDLDPTTKVEHVYRMVRETLAPAADS
jgi:hypothetical protein